MKRSIRPRLELPLALSCVLLAVGCIEPPTSSDDFRVAPGDGGELPCFEDEDCGPAPANCETGEWSCENVDGVCAWVLSGECPEGDSGDPPNPDPGDMGDAPGCPAATYLGADAYLEHEGVLTPGAGADVGSCGGDGNEAVFRWVAPHDGLYSIASYNSDFDTILYARDGGSCQGAELACDDDSGDTTQSELILGNLVEGQELYIVLDAVDATEGGSYLLTITDDP